MFDQAQQKKQTYAVDEKEKFLNCIVLFVTFKRSLISRTAIWHISAGGHNIKAQLQS